MKQIVPFKKELPFKTKVNEITSISLEREINVEEESIITGIFHITGDYKMNEGSINREEFSFDLPFDITLDPRYDIKTVKSDIDDFYYDVINNDTLSVSIDLFIEAEYLEQNTINNDIETLEKEEKLERKEVEIDTKEEVTEIIEPELDIKEEEEEIPTIEIKTLEEEIIKEEKKMKEDKKEINEVRENENIIASDLFANLDDKETYTTYYVYIVKEEDTIDKILSKYEITKEDFENYNDITNIKPGDKVIIPKRSEQ